MLYPTELRARDPTVRRTSHPNAPYDEIDLSIPFHLLFHQPARPVSVVSVGVHTTLAGPPVMPFTRLPSRRAAGHSTRLISAPPVATPLLSGTYQSRPIEHERQCFTGLVGLQYKESLPILDNAVLVEI